MVLGKHDASLGLAACIAFPPYPGRDLPLGRGSLLGRASLSTCGRGGRLRPGVGRAGWANSRVLGLGKGRRRMKYSPHPTLFKSCSLLRGSKRLVIMESQNVLC